MESSIYVGTLRHRRSSPVRHEFTYPLFMVFLDIDEIPKLMQVSPFTGYNRWSWASYHERDHFGDPAMNFTPAHLAGRKTKKRGNSRRPHLPVNASSLSRIQLQPCVVLLLLRPGGNIEADPRGSQQHIWGDRKLLARLQPLAVRGKQHEVPLPEDFSCVPIHEHEPRVRVDIHKSRGAPHQPVCEP